MTARAAPRPVRTVEMRVRQLAVDPSSNMPFVILTDDGELEAVPIGVGLLEASAIASHLENIELKRPVAHDLMKAIIGRCGLRVERVEVRDVRGATFYASIFLEREGEVIELDSRPSDAIALALRTGSRICVARKVVERTRKLGAQLVTRSDEARRGVACGGGVELKTGSDMPDLLALLSDEDFGKWKM